MGQQSAKYAKEHFTTAEFLALNRFPDGMATTGSASMWAMADCSILDVDPSHYASLRAQVQDRLHVTAGLAPNIPSFLLTEAAGDQIAPFTPRESRSIACILGNVIGDALGAPLEFQPVRYNQVFLTGLPSEEDEEEKEEDAKENNHTYFRPPFNRFRLRPGQWTDDSSMALCLMDSLLSNEGFDARDLRLRFQNWWRYGLNNAFGQDVARGDRRSVGLGGNIHASLAEFEQSRTEYTRAGDKETSGNGSLMRNSPVAVYYAHDLQQAEEHSARQSLTTHQGEEAAECCRLLSHAVHWAIGHPRGGREAVVEVLDRLPDTFRSSRYSVSCLAGSRREERHDDNVGTPLQDRDWNWKHADFRYSPTRSVSMPGYIGSYAMDNLAMSLHCLYHTDSFQAAVLRAANLCGDADSVAAVVGQLAGAFYGIAAIPWPWIQTVQRWDRGGDIALKAWLLTTHEPLRPFKEQ